MLLSQISGILIPGIDKFGGGLRVQVRQKDDQSSILKTLLRIIKAGFQGNKWLEK